MTQLSNILKGLIGDFQKKKKSASEFFNGLAMILHVPSMLWRSKLGTVSNADECFMQFKDIALDSDGVIRVKGVKGHQMLWHPLHISVKLYDLIPNDFHYSLYC